MRRNWFIAAIAIGVVAVVVAALAMRASDDGPESAAEWADSVCTSLGDWRASITALADVGGEPLTADSLGERLDEADDATRELVSELRDLGAPDLDAGDEVEEELDASVEELDAAFEALRESAQGAADAPASEFLQALAGLADDFAALQTAVGATLSALQGADVGEESEAELRQAFADSESCQALQGES